ncbi:hypothetical protein [Brachybacterium hainanense]|uniref:Uncharacterized protein n=1 Tax=Brachybacterium hainanense TaxID=1541174 RepID=A0ABV6R8M8_9MICO
MLLTTSVTPERAELIREMRSDVASSLLDAYEAGFLSGLGE